jgi:prepilin-type N-terminal cleavage/methylation domain-containing protein
MTGTEMMRRVRAGFTLVELLVVMAITIILLGLIFGPMIQGFNLTNRARVQVLAQDTARQVMETTQRELANGVFVFDNSNQPINFWVPGPNAGDPPIVMQIPFGMVDLVPPARVNDQNTQLTAADIDPTTGLAINRGDVALPLAPGRVIVRMWLGLRNNASMRDSSLNMDRPINVYRNFYEDRRNVNFDDHNPFILYRAVVSPYTVGGKVDTRLFHTPTNNPNIPILNDPNFFYDNSVAVQPNDPTITSNAIPGWKDLNGDGSVNISENWRAIARAVVPLDRADMVQVERDENRRPLYYTYTNNNGPQIGMRIRPLVTFQPTYVGNDAGSPNRLSDPGNEAGAATPTTHLETYGHWTTPFNLYVFRSRLNDPMLRYFYWDGVSSSVTNYQLDTANGNLTSTPANFDPNNPYVTPANPPQIMFGVDTRRGVVNFAYPHTISQTAPYQPATFLASEANSNRAVEEAAGRTPLRYISLERLDASLNPNGPSPLTFIPNVRIVPGTEIVSGPDMRLGPNYGREITYTRVPRNQVDNLGPNEYVINNEDRPNILDPNEIGMKRGTIIFRSLPGVENNLPETYVDANGVSQPAAPIKVSYQIQNNLPSDVVKTDYLTRSLMTFSLGVRLYDLNSGQPQQVNLTQKIQVRNLQR